MMNVTVFSTLFRSDSSRFERWYILEDKQLPAAILLPHTQLHRCEKDILCIPNSRMKDGKRPPPKTLHYHSDYAIHLRFEILLFWVGSPQFLHLYITPSESQHPFSTVPDPFVTGRTTLRIMDNGKLFWDARQETNPKDRADGEVDGEVVV
jgi:hypothetical protein